MVGMSVNGPARDRVMKLMEEKDKIENDIRDQTAILESNRIGMSEPLVDDEGYPRGDIDVYKVRNARHQIICLQNDHKSIMKRIEQGLAEVHADILGTSDTNHREATTTNGHAATINGDGATANGHGATINGQSSASNGLASLTINGHNSHGDTARQAFAKIARVENGSPADVGGISEGDELLQFGSVNHDNFVDMTQINNIVLHSVNQRVNVQVKRGQHIINLTVTPRPWAQPGLLGCQIVRLIAE